MTFPKRTVVLTLTTVAAAFITGAGASGHKAGASGAASVQAVEPTIVGTWQTRVRQRNCETGELGTASIRGLFTYHEGGTVSEWGVRPGSSPAMRSPGHGVWRREHGWQRYSFAFAAYAYTATGVYDGRVRSVAEVELDASGETWVSNSTVEFFDANDNLAMRGCASAVGTRFQ